MPGIGTSVESESLTVVTGGLGGWWGGGERGLSFNGYGVREDEKVLEVDGGDGYTTM